MNYVEQIYDQLVTIAEAELVGWQRLKKVFQPEQNDFRNIEMGFGIRHGAAGSDTDATKVFILSQRFEILLVHRAANRDSDLAVQERLHTLYSKADDIFQESVRSKLSLGFVTHVDGLDFAEPSVLENGSVLLVAGMDVRYYVDPY